MKSERKRNRETERERERERKKERSLIVATPALQSQTFTG